MAVMDNIERHDPDTGARLYRFQAWKREYHWRYEFRAHPDVPSHVVWDKRIDKPVVILGVPDNGLTESVAIKMTDLLNKAYFELYPHRVRILVA